MKRWHDFLTKATTTIADNVDDLGDDIRTLAKQIDTYRQTYDDGEPIYIQPYLGYGTAHTFYLRGRVLADPRLDEPTADDTVWKNLKAMYQRFETDELANMPVELHFQESHVSATTDKEGYYAVELQLPHRIESAQDATATVWYDVQVQLAPEALNGKQLIQTTSQVIVPPETSTVGIISDLDDTVLQTNATNLLKMARATFLHNSRTRMPFAGVAAFYQALQRGASGTLHNPIFYVSSSPWNLYDLLADFMQFHGLPQGPLFLRDLGFSRDIIQSSGHHSHKLSQIQQILTTYPELPFILIGDSGQEDPEIYQTVVQQFPNRIAAIYIRDVSLDSRDMEVDEIIDSVGRHEIDMIRVADTVTAAEHAAEHGFLAADALPAIREDKRQDDG